MTAGVEPPVAWIAPKFKKRCRYIQRCVRLLGWVKSSRMYYVYMVISVIEFCFYTLSVYVLNVLIF